MKYLKMLVPAVLAAAALMAFVGAGTASATVLCKNNLNTTTCSEKYGAGTEVAAHLIAGTKAKLSTEFKTIECSKSPLAGKTESAGGSTTTIIIIILTFGLEECNCEVKVLKNGSSEWHVVVLTDNWLFTWSGWELTTTCSTIFGSVHCIYVTESTNMGTGTGGNPAKISFNASIPRLTTNSLCSKEANLSAEYEVTSPKPLFAASS